MSTIDYLKNTKMRKYDIKQHLIIIEFKIFSKFETT